MSDAVIGCSSVLLFAIVEQELTHTTMTIERYQIVVRKEALLIHLRAS